MSEYKRLTTVFRYDTTLEKCKKCECLMKREPWFCCRDMPCKGARKALNRLAAYEDSGLSAEQAQGFAKAEAEGRLVVLPCNVGDIVELRMCGKCLKYRFMGIVQQNGYMPTLYGRQLFAPYQDRTIANVNSWNETVFLVEAAEKALGGGEG